MAHTFLIQQLVGGMYTDFAETPNKIWERLDFLVKNFRNEFW